MERVEFRLTHSAQECRLLRGVEVMMMFVTRHIAALTTSDLAMVTTKLQIVKSQRSAQKTKR